MGRLENLQPQLKAGQFTASVGGGTIYTTSENVSSPTLTPPLHNFLEFCKGSYSVKEICMFVYDRHKEFSFTEIMRCLEDGANSGIFKNAKDILDAMKAGKEAPKSAAPAKALSKDELVMHLRRVSLFANLPMDTIKAIMEGGEQRTYKTGEIIIKRDTMGQEAFVLLSGSVGVFSAFYMLGKGEPLATLPALSVFGESAAVLNKKRTADVVALTDSQVLVINLKKITEPNQKADLNKNLKIRLVFHQLMRLHPVFKNLPPDIIQMLLTFCQIENMPAHKTVVQQGEMGNKFYFILSGAVHVIKDRLPEVRLAVGSFFGEMSILKRQMRTASIVTETDCIFLVLTERNFITLLSTNLRLAAEMEKEIANRASKPVPETIEGHTDPEITEEITQKLGEFENYDFSTAPVGNPDGSSA